MNSKFPKPIIKWVGGKTQIIDKIITKFPNKMNNYREIFVGGGSILLALLYYNRNNKIEIKGNIYAYDCNIALIFLYKNIQKNHILLYKTIRDIIKEYEECGDGKINRKPQNIEEAKISRENYYYWIRNLYNKLDKDEKKSVYASSLFIFLNKTCFRGIFRESSNGFNVPYGNYSKPEIINKEHLNYIHNLIKNVIFECYDFSISLKKENILKDDFVYLDPPYIPIKNNSFTGYTKDGFDIEKHKKLFYLIQQNCNNFILNNSDTEIIREFFKEDKYQITTILCKRNINSKNPGTKSKEIIITNQLSN